MKNQKLWTILSIFVAALLALAEILTLTVIVKVDTLPVKYIAVLAALMVIGVAGIALLLFLRIKGGISLRRRVIACVLAILAVCACTVVSSMFHTHYKTVQSISIKDGETENDVLATIPTGEHMYVLIRADDPNTTLKAIANYSYGMVANYEAKKTAKFIEWLGSKTGVTPQPVEYQIATELADALLNKEVDAIIITGVLVTNLETMDGYGQFTSKVKTLAEVPYAQLKDPAQDGSNNANNSNGTNGDAGSIGATGPSNATGPDSSGMLGGTGDNKEPEVEQPAQEKNVTNTPFAVYIGGSDESGLRNDVNILMVVNPNTKQILLINTPRDAYVINPKSDEGAMDKLTHCGIYGPDCSQKALSILYGTDIAFFGQINFKGFRKLIDAIGGITVYSDQAFTTSIDSYRIQKGDNHLNGAQALAFARERYRINGGDNGRGKNQMKVISAVVKKLTTSTALITNYASIMSSLQGMFKTSMQADQINMLVKMQLNDMASWDVNTFSVTGREGSEITYSWPGAKLYVMHLNQNYVDHASNLVGRVVNGEFLKPEDMKVPS